MRYTSKGYKIPTGDDQDFWDQNEYNTERLNDHNHDGVNSTKIRAGGIEPYSVEIEVADWVGASAPYTCDIEFPISWSMTWASGSPCPVQVVVRDSDGTQVFLDVTRLTDGDGVQVSSSVKAIYTVGLY